MKLPWTLINKDGAELPFKKFENLVDYVDDLIYDPKASDERKDEKPSGTTLKQSRKWYFTRRMSRLESSNIKAKFEAKGDPFFALKEEIYDETYEDDSPLYNVEYENRYGERNGEMKISMSRIKSLKADGCRIIELNTAFEEEYPYYSALLTTMLIGDTKKSNDSDKRGKNLNSLRNLKQYAKKDQAF
ncbi:MAG: hypothetical protein M1161_02855 [Candidatus Thermoplasmatota archaeon]|jgi:hypothetical protein|nr:hypothetical protein [Candidatus Thermoplasmatota archaeon]